MVLVSVIVPAYNVERYVEKCINSLLNQTFTDFEVLLIDDGSTDNTVNICDELAKKDNRIKVFHKENGGLSDARNYGLERVLGEYITFVDSDDYVSPTYLQELYEPITESGIDIVITPLHYFYENNPPVFEKLAFNYSVISAEEAVKKMLNRAEIGHCSCGKLFKKGLWGKIRFPVGWLYEDYLTTFYVMENVKNVAITANKTYFYLQRENSIMHYKCNEKTVKLVDVTQQVTPRIVEIWPNLKIEAEAFQIANCLKCFQNILNDNPKEFLDAQKRVKGIVREKKWELLFSSKVLFNDKVKIVIFLMGTAIFKKVYNIFDGTKQHTA